MVATVAPPRVFPIITVKRGTGATSVSFKNPNCRSHRQADARKDRSEKHRHSDDAGRDELEIAAVSGLLKDRTETETEHEQI